VKVSGGARESGVFSNFPLQVGKDARKGLPLTELFRKQDPFAGPGSLTKIWKDFGHGDLGGRQPRTIMAE
jgi:hypothetical protein